ncbi:cytochrome ubiquinol oxidase subunit I [Neptunomonas phycophila]|jgi:cytochrome d ubiquinol oxidase subunit I|uniref:Cytochrome ubiquinol oxidase subunit I n=3 Tax=Neptunomonas phycophila TaxID=1572645 RepID=A0AAW7XIM6_9GAMM|nr:MULTISPECIES: cytochrome ubiquinol oxidase subunit I [Neptunomonas]MBT3144853.1 cytochrome ubiquinol oxidase subunit I [Neptunomonas phycophila]MDN2658343.1 cytochrome ubiquinol oxidase subunit I [Neptunomonas sp. CHC150]MDO6454168.1 cytochrome ubiquinol oxidase subunit I [Neptunomonas phycophila]MDO6468693.1 cytochrome ubiquinol oxidase subunit I [Neptunomonas phycophila]MDO6785587.1 cytochrome ubiquinol oxidase subunit I [Neptunomonas phycophila]
MFDLSAVDLARVQFAFTVSFHIIFPAITIGLASYLAVLEGLWLTKKNPIYRDLYHFWSKIFAVNFAMGVVSGLVMSYEFGTNWSAFSTFAGGVTGPLLAYEVLTAFFLEAGFLGVMLFGWNRVGPGLHFFSTIMVAVGTLISMTWILASNSWMQTPQGYEIVDGRVVPVDWIEIIFNPSFPYRLVHMALAAFLATALFVAASGAWHMLKGSAKPHAQKMFSMAMWMLLITAPLQIIAGDFHGLNTLEHQPAKIAAMEGHWENEPGEEGVPLILFGWPDMEAEETKYALKIPHLGSLILTHTWDGQFEGLKSFAPEDRPYAPVVFWSFRIMVALGMLMLLLGVCGLWLRWKKRLYESPLFLKFALAMGPAGLIAILAGWFTTEVGRQPWVVYGVMRTVDAASDHSVAALTTTLVAFVVVYFAVFGIGVKYMLSLIKEGPEEHHDPADGEDSTHRPARPLSAVSDEVKL